MHTVTCHTEGCENEGQAIPMDLDSPADWDPPAPAVSAVYCGACGQQITDVEPPLGAP